MFQKQQKKDFASKPDYRLWLTAVDRLFAQHSPDYTVESLLWPLNPMCKVIGKFSAYFWITLISNHVREHCRKVFHRGLEFYRVGHPLKALLNGCRQTTVFWPQATSGQSKKFQNIIFMQCPFSCFHTTFPLFRKLFVEGGKFSKLMHSNKGKGVGRVSTEFALKVWKKKYLERIMWINWLGKRDDYKSRSMP